MMRKLLSPAAFHVVAWINKAEWDQVLEYLYCQDCNLQKYALERISAWKGRYGSSTPIAVESTADLVRCQVIDSCEQVAPEELVLLYGMALVRFVNLITEPKQKMMTIPLRRLAREMNIPEWIVNLRHQLTHGRLPTLNWCRKGCEFVLDWLRKEYWSRQLGSIPSEYCELGSDEAEVKEEEMAEANEEENKEKYAVSAAAHRQREHSADGPPSEGCSATKGSFSPPGSVPTKENTGAEPLPKHPARAMHGQRSPSNHPGTCLIGTLSAASVSLSMMESPAPPALSACLRDSLCSPEGSQPYACTQQRCLTILEEAAPSRLILPSLGRLDGVRLRINQREPLSRLRPLHIGGIGTQPFIPPFTLGRHDGLRLLME
ncbi:LAS1L protein, partial [Polypterus senegalus]